MERREEGLERREEGLERREEGLERREERSWRRVLRVLRASSPEKEGRRRGKGRRESLNK